MSKMQCTVPQYFSPTVRHCRYNVLFVAAVTAVASDKALLKTQNSAVTPLHFKFAEPLGSNPNVCCEYLSYFLVYCVCHSSMYV